MNPTLAHAMAYAAAGWPVFPCPPGLKTPFPRSRGFKDATTDPAVIRRWWAQDPDRNVAIATGAPGPDVLDIDVKADGDGYGALARLKHAGLTGAAQALVMTRSRGLHCYFTGSTQPCGSLPRHHIDFKATGGYVLAPPSRVEPGGYTLLDYRATTGRLDWPAVKQLLDPPREHATVVPSARRDSDSLAAWVARLGEGNRNNGLYWAARRAAETGTADFTPLVDAAVAAGLSEAEARRTIDSARRAAA